MKRPVYLIMLVTALVLTSSCKEKDDNPKASSNNNTTNTDPLNFFEEEILGKWSRYHSYDDSRQYIILNVDRTACKWEKPSSGGKKSYRNYGYWKLESRNGSTTVYDLYWGSDKNNLSKLHTYHYDTDEIWYGGYSNLRMSRTSSAISCD